MRAGLEDDAEARVGPQTCQGRLEADVGIAEESELKWGCEEGAVVKTGVKPRAQPKRLKVDQEKVWPEVEGPGTGVSSSRKVNVSSDRVLRGSL